MRYTAELSGPYSPDLTAKVAAQSRAIFCGRNKRTALVAAGVCLHLNGYRRTDAADVESFFCSIAQGGADGRGY